MGISISHQPNIVLRYIVIGTSKLEWQRASLLKSKGLDIWAEYLRARWTNSNLHGPSRYWLSFPAQTQRTQSGWEPCGLHWEPARWMFPINPFYDQPLSSNPLCFLLSQEGGWRDMWWRGDGYCWREGRLVGSLWRESRALGCAIASTWYTKGEKKRVFRNSPTRSPWSPWSPRSPLYAYNDIIQCTQMTICSMELREKGNIQGHGRIR